MKWIVSNGGYWNPPRLQLRYDEAQPDLYGVFARENISEGDILASIPWGCVIYNDNATGDTDRFDKECQMVKLLSDELKAQQKSKYSHYIASCLLASAKKKHSKILPAYWSKAGKDLLIRLVYDDEKQLHVLPPEDLFLDKGEWRTKCEAVDPMAVMTHGEDFGMVPLTDKFNCRGGNYTGAYFSIQNGDGDTALEIRALRSLEKGEQIYTGTPELLRDYGFVETHPQRWIFHKQQVAFDVTKENSKYEIEWHDKNCIGNPEGTNYSDCFFVAEYFRTQLDRLEQSVHPLIVAAPTQNNAPSAHELHTIRQYYIALTNALRLGLDTIEHSADAADEL